MRAHPPPSVELSKLRATEVEQHQRAREQSELIDLLEADLYRLQQQQQPPPPEARQALLGAGAREGQMLAEAIGEEPASRKFIALSNPRFMLADNTLC